MRNPLILLPALAFVAAQAAPGFKQSVPFAAFESWARAGSVPGMTFRQAVDEPEAYLAVFKAGSGAETLTVKLEGAGKFEGLAAGAAKFTWKGLDALCRVSGKDPALMAVRYGSSKATLSIAFSAGSKARAQADMEKLLAGLRPEKILK